jgi:AAA15 family ATPase/GTPase
MIIDFSVTNFRSIREKQTFSMLAYGGKSKLDNTFEIELANGKKIRLIKSAGIYGANSFGKSNFIKALKTLISLIKNSESNKVNETIKQYEPFLFNTESKKAPTSFEINFIINGKNKYRYSFSFDKDKIIEEELIYFPKGRRATIFTRKIKKGIVHSIKLGASFDNKEYELYQNQLALSKFGSDFVNEFIAQIYFYFTTIDIQSSLDIMYISALRRNIINDFKNESKRFQDKLNKLIKVADTKIESIVLKPIKSEDLPNSLPEEIKNKIIEQNEELFARHIVYDTKEQAIGIEDIKFSEESTGTNVLFALGGFFLQKIENGGIVVIDELDASLHPSLSRFLINLFNNKISNPNKAQLIFTSHEPHILDKNEMRADQIWFVDKNEFGETELYSAQDFDEIREDIPFDKWYLAGKFGAIPTINETELLKLFDNE